MSAASPEITDLISGAIDSALQNVRVSLPGIVKSYDAAKKTATVQPAIRRPVLDEDGAVAYEEWPPLQNVLVCELGGAKLSMHAPLEAGDSVLLIWQDYSIATWRKRGGVCDPPDADHHGPSYPVAVPIMRGGQGSTPGDDTDASVGIPGGIRLHFTTGLVKVGAGAQFVALATKIDTAFAALATWAAAFSPGGAAGAATGATAAAAAASALNALGTVASANLKAD